MDFAILGDDPPTRLLAEAILRSRQHRLVLACELGSEFGAMVRAAPGVELASNWEALIGAPAIDAVIVAGGGNEDLRAEQLRKLAQAGTAMLVAHPVHSSLLIYYELDMIRQDSGCRLVPILPTRLHPAVRRIADVTASGESEWGAIQQVVIERAVADHSAAHVLNHFARDVDLAAAICGDLTEISAMTSPGASGDYANLGVQMSGSSAVVARWSVAGVEPSETARLTVRGQRGHASIEMPADGSPWKWNAIVAGETAEEVFPDWDPAAAVLDHFSQTLEGDDSHPTWHDALRAMELADSIEISLRRGRTIQLHQGQASEEGTFKGMMASAGCGLLMLALLVSVAGLLLMWLEVPGAWAWPYVILAMFMSFLLLQLLKLAFARDGE
jgi:predicted dehydrogenase